MGERKPSRRSRTVRVMLDSGAFSAWTRGEEIDLGEYIDFVKTRAHLLDSYINLDVIPGQRGVRPTQKEVDHAAAASFDNYLSMRAEGVTPVPVFHFGEDRRWLEKLLDSGAPYISLGGTVGVRSSIKRKFFNDCFAMICNSRGEPAVRVHGLGVSEGQLVTAFPWHSVDSTSWAIAPIYGMILVPGESRFSAQIYVADGNLDARANSRRFERLPPSFQDTILEYVAGCGLTMTDLRNDVSARTAVFVRTLMGMEAPKAFGGSHANFLLSRGGCSAPAAVDFRMIFATNLTHRQGWVLTQCGAADRLLSYADLKKNDTLLEEYVERGVTGALKKWPDPDERARVDWASMSYLDQRRRQLAARYAESGDEE